MSIGPGGRPRRTLKTETRLLEGVGLHSGVDVSVRVRPAPTGAGLVFVDGASGQEIPARAANVLDTSRCTRLQVGTASVQTVEHLLSALAGLGIDDALMETWGGELPAMDGSAAPFAEALRDAGLRDQEGAPPVTALIPVRPLLISTKNGESLAVLPSDSFQITVILDYPEHPFIGTQAVTFDAMRGDYVGEIAPARTFGFREEIEYLHAHGLGLGASYDNALVLRRDGYDAPLRFPDELARHKLLDLIGDLALTGRPLQAHVIAIKPGHALNTRLALQLAIE